jgi:protein-L-isoaspartate(D-aspartate) O-methyltransferase
VSSHAELQSALVARLAKGGRVPDRVVEAFAAVSRHHFLPGVELATVYADDAVVTHDEGGVPTSSSSQPSLMARMLAELDVRPGDRVLEVGTGTGYNAALLARLGAAVTSVELQPEVAAAAAEHLAAAGTPVMDGSPPQPGTVRLETADGAAPPGGPYERIIVTAGCWSLPKPLVSELADGGTLVAPLRINIVEVAVALHRRGEQLQGGHGLPCGFMPLRGGDQRPWRWPLGNGGFATADADLGVEGRGAIDRLLATPGRGVPDPLALGEGEHDLDALLWLGLQGDPLLGLVLPAPSGRGRPPWRVALYVLPASLLVIEFSAPVRRVTGARLYGGEGALRACATAMDSWRAAGAPGPERLDFVIAPHGDRTGWSLPFAQPDGSIALVRGAHRWDLRFS